MGSLVFIFNFILLCCLVDGWPRYKRSYNEIKPTFTSSFYDKLKESLAPVLQKTINLSTLPAENNYYESPQKRAMKKEKKETPAEAFSGLTSNIHDLVTKIKETQEKRNLLDDRVFPASVKYDINTILVPHRGNQSTIAVSEHENDYDYSDRDLPDIEEPPAHIFEYNRANSSNKKVGKIALTPNPYLSYPLSFPLYGNNQDQSTQQQQFGSYYEKCKQNLAPLIGTKSEPFSKLQEKLFFPYGIDKKMDNTASKTEIANIETKMPIKKENLAYHSLYDQFKQRLQDFSSELGIDAGLSSEDQLSDIIANSDVKVNLNDNKRDLNTPEDISKAFRKAQIFVNEMEKRNEMSLKNRLNKLNIDDEAKNLKKKRANFNEGMQSSITSNSIAKNKLGADCDFWLQQRGYQYKNQNHKDEPNGKRNEVDNSIDFNAEKRDSNKNNAYVDGGCDYTEMLKPTSNVKNPKNSIDIYKRLFRGLNDMANNYLPDKKYVNDGSNSNKFFPNVLIEPIQTPMGSTSKLSAHGLLEDVANKLNMSTLEVAKKIVGIQNLNLTTLKEDPELHNTLQTYIENSVLAGAGADPAQFNMHLPKPLEQNSGALALQATTKSPFVECVLMPNSGNNGCPWEETKLQPKPNPIEIPKAKIEQTTNNKASLSDQQVSKILEKLLVKLQELQFEKTDCETPKVDALQSSSSSQPTSTPPLEDTPCKLSGSWFSIAMGLRFDLSFSNKTENDASQPEDERFGLKVNVKECVPPKPHDIFDTKWPFTGSAMKEIGGPFYLYTQKKSENILATFVGFCRTCGNMDMIFGTWSFSLPAKCCQDTPASFQTKNDVMHRYSLDEKRRERYKQILHKKSKYV